MGKKSKDPGPTPELPDSVRSLFAADNPFRRKPSTGKPQIPTTTPPAAAMKRPLEKDANLNPSASPTPTDSAPKKRKKKLEADGDGGDGGGENHKRKRRKRKRDEVESDYERRKYGSPALPAPAVPVVGEKRKAPDAAAEMAAAAAGEEEEAFDDENKLLRTVFVGNLPLKTKRKALARDFATFGEVESVRIRSVPLVDSKVPRKGAIIKGKINDSVDNVHAYIVFKDGQSARAALSHNMALFGRNHVRVDMACPPHKKHKGEGPLYDRKRTVFIGNLPFDVKDEELYQLFCGSNGSEANIEAVRVIRDPNTSLGKGIAYVLFKSREAANSVVRKHDLKIRDRLLRLSHAKSSDAAPKKRMDAGTSRDARQQKLALGPGNKSHERNDKTKRNASTLSYQGLRSSKSGVVKKTRLNQRPSKQWNEGKTAEAGESPRKAKRPAVAVRKAKQLLKKRKLDAPTPENTHRNKKPKK